MRHLTVLFVFLSACATRPPAPEIVRAPAAGFVRGLKINGEGVSAGVCTLFVKGIAIPLSEGAAFVTELPVGHVENSTISCSRGLFATDITLNLNQEMDIAPDALNWLADFDFKLVTERNSLGMYLVGGQVSVGLKYKPLSRELMRNVLRANGDLKKRKTHAAIKFDYVRVSGEWAPHVSFNL